MDLKTIVLLPLMVGVVIFALFGFMSELNTNYGVTIDGNHSQTYTRIESAVNSSLEVGEELEGLVEDSERASIVGDVLLVSGGIWKAIKLPFQSLVAIKDMFGTMLNALPFPAWVSTLIFGFLVVLVTFIILGAIIRYKL